MNTFVLFKLSGVSRVIAVNPSHVVMLTEDANDACCKLQLTNGTAWVVQVNLIAAADALSQEGGAYQARA